MFKGGLSLIVCTCLVLVFLTPLPYLQAQTNYPEIPRLQHGEPLFDQLVERIAESYRLLQSGSPPPAPLLFLYRPGLGESLFTLAARLSVPVETIATLNRLTHPDAFASHRTVVLTTLPGLYIPREPRTELEYLMRSWREPSFPTAMEVLVRDDNEAVFQVLPGERFHQTERSFFLGLFFRFPLSRGHISSSYGPREHPISGDRGFHRGIDIAAPLGAEVLASRGGTVFATGEDPELGIYVILQHEAGYSTAYGHLQSIRVRLNQSVRSGTIVGYVGTTGLSTGPHLHFEVRSGGSPRNPAEYLHGLDS